MKRPDQTRSARALFEPVRVERSISPIGLSWRPHPKPRGHGLIPGPFAAEYYASAPLLAGHRRSHSDFCQAQGYANTRAAILTTKSEDGKR